MLIEDMGVWDLGNVLEDFRVLEDTRSCSCFWNIAETSRTQISNQKLQMFLGNLMIVVKIT